MITANNAANSNTTNMVFGFKLYKYFIFYLAEAIVIP